ncbi:hypothetical protein JDV02_010424 [Purpureocillium takamizusanense]|uniref:Zn(2)-C6 fungal-type domain-containing protein n=1 Tax=Purpureocillium takamizusanense TaxID=2060973 RepID=A0A9Q8VGL4_9HYPO|nr:uncharacterized protein JDV02_010424 [Purpureocillium takamizusanense]UNI24696.1 hypothetical protein JDV02_010424 [Purpureocillium takamizusanense]
MDGRKRHCWECRRRYLVCDSAEPACNRCISSGIACPGYGPIKPTRLRWVEPGKVSSRGRRSTKASSGNAHLDTNKATGELVHANHAMTPPPVLTSEIDHLAQAAQYFNECIYRDLLPITQLGHNPQVYSITPTILQQAVRSPSYLQFGMVCMTLNHRMNQLRHHQSMRLAERFYHYRGIAIRSLSEQLGETQHNTDDVVLAGVVTLLLVDVQHNASLGWRWHLEGIHKIVNLRGGYPTLVRSKVLQPLLLSVWFVAVFGNTTGPASDISMADLHLKSVPMMLDQYNNGTSPFHLCPPLLFAEIIRINHLRWHVARHGKIASLSQTAGETFQRIRDFSPEKWAGSKHSTQDIWTLVGNTYQAAAGLYCILSLQSSSVFPKKSTLQSFCASTGRALQRALKGALSHRGINRFMLWPLVTLGVQAKNDIVMRGYVSHELTGLSTSMGTCSPLIAKSVLERFWASGENCWDACFDRPYVFTMQLAVDTRQLIASL